MFSFLEKTYRQTLFSRGKSATAEENMSGLFAQIIRQAKITSDPKYGSKFKANFLALKQLVDNVTVNDLNIQPELYARETFDDEDKAPCTFIQIYENPNVSISVFILADSYTMPLHDHPMIFGILKAIAGKLSVQSFSAVDAAGTGEDSAMNNRNKIIDVTVEPAKVLTARSDSALLTPTECNFHEITALEGPAAFFDILTPPYEADIPIYGPRKCSFYRKVLSSPRSSPTTTTYSTDPIVSCENGLKTIRLEKIRCPPHYYTDTGFYEPPPFLLDP